MTPRRSPSRSPTPPRSDRKRQRSESKERDQPAEKKPRFKFVKNKHKNNYTLPENLAEYINQLSFVPDEDVQSNILDANPVPTNVSEVPRLDHWFERMLKDAGCKEAIGRDKQLARIDRKIREILGRLAPIITQVEDAMGDPNAQFDIDDLKDRLEKTACLINQARGAVTYQRQRTALGALSKSDSKAKETLSTHSDHIKQGGTDKGLLFGENLRSEAKRTSSKEDKVLDFFGAAKKKPFSKTHTPNYRRGAWGANAGGSSSTGGAGAYRAQGNSRGGGKNYQRGKFRSFISITTPGQPPFALNQSAHGDSNTNAYNQISQGGGAK